MTILEIGDDAPKFELQITENTQITLSDFKGKFVVLYFYPKDNTPGCTMQAKDFTCMEKEFKDLGVEVIGVSRDSLKSHDKFKDKYNLYFNLGSDPEGKTCEQYGTWVEKSMFGKKYMGIQRATFLIDKDGKIAHIWPKVSIKGHALEVLNTVKAAIS